jgi:hypothetical protein
MEPWPGFPATAVEVCITVDGRALVVFEAA